MCRPLRQTIWPKAPLSMSSHGLYAEPAAEAAVEGRGGAAALQVAKHRDADVHLEEPPSSREIVLPDPAQALDHGHCRRAGSFTTRSPPGKAPSAATMTLKRLPAPPALDDGVADLLDVVGDLRDEDHVGAAGDAGFQRDPAGVAPHHLQDHDPVVALGGGVQLVQCVGGGLHRGVEAEGDVGLQEIVVDGLGHADDRDAALHQFQRDLQRAVPADHDERPDPAARILETTSSETSTSSTLPVRIIGNEKGFPRLVVPRMVPPRGRMPRTSSRVRASALLGMEQAVESVLYADHLPAAAVSRRFTTPLMTAFRPGQSPPPVSIPILLVFLHSHKNSRSLNTSN